MASLPRTFPNPLLDSWVRTHTRTTHEELTLVHKAKQWLAGTGLQPPRAKEHEHQHTVRHNHEVSYTAPCGARYRSNGECKGDTTLEQKAVASAPHCLIHTPARRTCVRCSAVRSAVVGHPECQKGTCKSVGEQCHAKEPCWCLGCAVHMCVEQLRSVAGTPHSALV